MFNKFSEEVNSLVVFFQFFGLAPFARDQNLSRILYIYSLIHLFAIIMVFVSGVFINDIFTDNFGSLSTIVGGLVFSGLIFCHFLVVLHAFTSRKEQMEIFDKFDQIDNIFQKKLNSTIKYVELKKKYRNKIIIVSVILLIIKGIFIGAILFNLTNPSYWMHCFYSLFVIRVRCIQNMFYVDVVTDKVEMINTKLNELISLDKDKNNKIIFLERYQNNDFKIYKKPIYDQVQLLKQAYGFVWDITNLINDSFGWSLLAITTQGFIEFTSNGYWLFLSLEGLIGDNMAVSKYRIYFIFIVNHITKFIGTRVSLINLGRLMNTYL